MAVGEKGKQLAELAPCTFAACDHSQLAATSCREHVPKLAELWDNFKRFVTKFQAQSVNLRTLFQSKPPRQFTSTISAHSFASN